MHVLNTYKLCIEPDIYHFFIFLISFSTFFFPGNRPTQRVLIKPGNCPPITRQSCQYPQRRCFTDKDCNADAKCCSDGCIVSCVKPVTNTNIQNGKYEILFQAKHFIFTYCNGFLSRLMYSGNEIFLHCLEQFSCGYEKLTVRTAPLMTMRVPCREYKRSSIDAVYAPCSNRAVYCLTWEYQD